MLGQCTIVCACVCVYCVCNKLWNSMHAFGKHIQCTPKYFVLECISFLFLLVFIGMVYDNDDVIWLNWPMYLMVFDWIFVCMRCGRFVLRALIERVQTFNNEIVCIQPKDIENVPKNWVQTPNHAHTNISTTSTTISQRHKYGLYIHIYAMYCTH